MPSASGINADVIIRASLSWLRLPLASAELLRFLAKDDARYLNNTALTRDRAPRSYLPVTQRTPTQIISPGPWINPQLWFAVMLSPALPGIIAQRPGRPMEL